MMNGIVVDGNMRKSKSKNGYNVESYRIKIFGVAGYPESYFLSYVDFRIVFILALSKFKGEEWVLASDLIMYRCRLMANRF